MVATKSRKRFRWKIKVWSGVLQVRKVRSFSHQNVGHQRKKEKTQKKEESQKERCNKSVKGLEPRSMVKWSMECAITVEHQFTHSTQYRSRL